MPATNILFITTDHLRYDTLGITGDPVIRTPSIDALARQSLSYDRYFVQSPVCMPSRATIMTGRYPRHHGVRWNFSALNENEMTVLEHFKRSGYATACIGKYHLTQNRFEAALDHREAEGLRNMDPDNPFVRYVAERGYTYLTGFALPDFQRRLGAVPRPELPEDCHLDSWVGTRARAWLTARDSSKPFFLWLGFYGPHHPYIPTGRFASMYRAEEVPGFHRSSDDLARKPPEYRLFFDVAEHKFHGFAGASERTFREMKAAYYGTVSLIDWQVGLVLKTLEETGLDRSTSVIFTSDHGELLGDHGIPAKGPFLLDSILHVPLVIRPAARAEAGTRTAGVTGQAVSDLVESVDLFPTLCRLAGIETPPWVQGSELPGLRPAPPESPPRSAVYAEAMDKSCHRTAEWKLIHYAGKDYGELYDLRADPWELANLWDEQPDVVERLTEEHNRHRDEIEDFRHPTYMRYEGTDPVTGRRISNYLTW